MGGFLEFLLLRAIPYVALPLLLVVLAVGRRRFVGSLKKAWQWVWKRRLEPEEIFSEVVRQHEKHIAEVRAAIQRMEIAQAEIDRNIRKSRDNMAMVEEEARHHVASGDDLGARAALYKVNLERSAIKTFEEQLERQRQLIMETRRRLYLLELQLRQYEVGRSILLSQLAEARTVEQQYAIANNFDPFSAIANWQEAEGMVQEKALNAKAVEHVYTDLAELPLAGQPAAVDPATLDAQLEALKARVSRLDPMSN